MAVRQRNLAGHLLVLLLLLFCSAASCSPYPGVHYGRLTETHPSESSDPAPPSAPPPTSPPPSSPPPTSPPPSSPPPSSPPPSSPPPSSPPPSSPPPSSPPSSTPPPSPSSAPPPSSPPSSPPLPPSSPPPSSPPSPPIPPTSPPPSPQPPSPCAPDAVKKWCVVKPGTIIARLKHNIWSACVAGKADCRPIARGGMCFFPNTFLSHASYAMNAYYQSNGRNDSQCDFAGSGLLITVNPSYGRCVYPS